jgi:hypothetical protein
MTNLKSQYIYHYREWKKRCNYFKRTEIKSVQMIRIENYLLSLGITPDYLQFVNELKKP